MKTSSDRDVVAPPVGVTPDDESNGPPPGRSDMTRTIAHYERLDQIGEGTYGQVYRAKCLDSGRIVAMKKMRIISRYVNGIPPQLIREIKILKQLRHPNLLRMIEVVTSKGAEHLDPDDPTTTGDSSKNKKEDSNEDPVALARERYKGNLFLVLEYVTHDLTGLLDVAYQFTPVQIKGIFQQLLKALEYMHGRKLVHRDIKSSNILIDSHFRLKLADFGLARSLEPTLMDKVDGSKTTNKDWTNKVITLWYRSPEILLGAVNYSFGVDIWSAGCILVELLTSKPLAAGKSELQQLQLLANLTGTPDADTWNHLFSLKKTKQVDERIPVAAKEWSRSSEQRKTSKLRDKMCNKRGIEPVVVNLLEKLLEWDPRKRLTATHALDNKYFWNAVPLEDLGQLDVAEDGHFHEFQTKPKRREAKIQADRAKEMAMEQGKSAEESDRVYDETYRSIMKQVAKEGIKTVKEDKTKAAKEDTASRKSAGSERRHGGDGDEKVSRRRSSDDDSERKRRKKRSRRDHDDSSRGERKRRSIEGGSRRSEDERRDRRSKKEDEDRYRRHDSVERELDETSERRRRRKKEHRRHKSGKRESRRRDYDKRSDRVEEYENRDRRPEFEVPPRNADLRHPGDIPPGRNHDTRNDYYGDSNVPPDGPPRGHPPRREMDVPPPRRDHPMDQPPPRRDRPMDQPPPRGDWPPRRNMGDRTRDDWPPPHHRMADHPPRGDRYPREDGPSSHRRRGDDDYRMPHRDDRPRRDERGPDGAPPGRRDWRDDGPRRMDRPRPRDMPRDDYPPPRDDRPRDMPRDDYPPPRDDRPRDMPRDDYPPPRDDRYGERSRRPHYDDDRRAPRRDHDRRR